MATTGALPHKLKLWYQHFVKGQNTFEDSLHEVCSISTAADFWAYYQHFNRPSQLSDGSYIYLFKEEVKPVWEDQHNKHGGAFVLRFERSKSDRLWEDILLGFLAANKERLTTLNGIRIKIRKQIAEFDFWLSKVDDEKILQDYREWIVKVTSLDDDTPLEVIHFHAQE